MMLNLTKYFANDLHDFSDHCMVIASNLSDLHYCTDVREASNKKTHLISFMGDVLAHHTMPEYLREDFSNFRDTVGGMSASEFLKNLNPLKSTLFDMTKHFRITDRQAQKCLN